MSVLLEDHLPVVQYNGLNTNKAVTFGGAVTFNGSQVQRVLASSGNTTLTAAQSGAAVLFDTAAGITFTLPAPQVGLNFNFIVKTTVTSSNHKIITDAGTTFMQGALILGAASDTAGLFQGNGTSHVAVTMGGTTNGGVLGSIINTYCITSTLWQVEGNVVTVGSPVTPFTTS